MAKVFISYSRKDIDFAKRLTGELQKSNLDFWIDWEGIPPTVDWWREIEKGIEEADIFVFLISPYSSKSDVCQQEIRYAVKNGKRLIPLVVRKIRSEEAPEQLSHLNWLFFRDTDDFDAALEKLLTGIHTDYEWVQAHRRLQVKALEWERNSKEKSFLLRGRDLQNAELDLATNTSKDPHPTDLQREYVFESRKVTDRQRRITTGVSMAGIIALAALAVFGFIQASLATRNAKESQNNASTAQANLVIAQTAQANEAQAKATAIANEQEAKRQAQISRARQLAAQSSALQDTNFRVSLLLGSEAFNLLDDLQTRGNMLNIVNAKPQLRQIFTGHTGDTNDVVFSPNGKIIASAGWDGKIGLWDVNTGKKIGGFLKGHDGWVYGIAFSPDGKTLASAGADGAIMLWDVESGKQIGAPIWDYGASVMSVAFSPDGKTLAAAGFLNKIILLDVKTRQIISPPMVGHTDIITTVAFSPDGRTLASGGYDDKVILWDVGSRRQIGQLTGHHSWVFCIAFSPDGKTLASGGNDDTVILWNIETLQVIDRPMKVSGPVDGVDFSPDGSILAFGSGTSLILWDVTTQEMLGQPLTGHAYAIREVAFSPDGRNIITAGGVDGTIFLWDTQSSSLSVTGIGTVAFSPDGKTFASADGNAISLWDTTHYEKFHRLIGHSDWVNAIAFSPDGKTIASGGYDNTIIIWDVNTGKSIGQLKGHTGEINSIAFNPNGKTIASGSSDNTIIIWDVETLQPIGKPLNGHSAFVTSVVFSPDGNTLASSGWDSTIILWDVGTQKIIGQPIYSDFVTSLAFSPDGKILASGSYSTLVTLWDVATHKMIGSPLKGHSNYIQTVAFSPDGKILVSGGFDKTIIVWDMETRRPIGQPLNGTDTIYSVAFSHDGKTLASGSLGSIMIWNLDPLSWIQVACQRAGGNLTKLEWERYFPGEEYRKTCEQWPLEL